MPRKEVQVIADRPRIAAMIDRLKALLAHQDFQSLNLALIMSLS
jgi:hypothetical protein